MSFFDNTLSGLRDKRFWANILQTSTAQKQSWLSNWTDLSIMIQQDKRKIVSEPIIYPDMTSWCFVFPTTK